VTPTTSRARIRTAWLLFGALLTIYNSNGREIGAVDSQPTKFTARELAVRGTFTLDRVVALQPGFARRTAFVRTYGHYLSAYPLLPAMLAAVPAALLHWTHLADMDAPLAPNLIAVIAASLLTAGAVALVYLALTRLVTPRLALGAAIALGIGTNYWPVVSRTLWQHETVAFGLALALVSCLRPANDIRSREIWLGGIGLAMAGAARPQTSVMVALMLAWMIARVGLRRAWPAGAIVAAAAILVLVVNDLWFGSWMGGLMHTEAASAMTHGVSGTFSGRLFEGLAGLLVSPSRGLLIFSPLAAAFGIGALKESAAYRDFDLRWLVLAVCGQLLVYGFYSVWWAGHTFGPRYTLDLLVPAAPLAALGAAAIARWRIGQAIMWLLLVWSIAVAMAGAFIYPAERFNTDPDEIDAHHDRLWSVRDSQLVRIFHAPLSPQNFELFTAATVRVPDPDR
jgi:hypothetical protein